MNCHTIEYHKETVWASLQYHIHGCVYYVKLSTSGRLLCALILIRMSNVCYLYVWYFLALVLIDMVVWASHTFIIRNKHPLLLSLTWFSHFTYTAHPYPEHQYGLLCIHYYIHWPILLYVAHSLSLLRIYVSLRTLGFLTFSYFLHFLIY